jgi:hypothetical protein
VSSQREKSSYGRGSQAHHHFMENSGRKRLRFRPKSVIWKEDLGDAVAVAA